MKPRLDSKIAIITGAASGIGRACAIMFAREGARIVVADIDDAGGDKTVKIITSYGGEAVYVHTDVTRASDAEDLVKATISKFGRIDILFNNAGVTQAITPVEELDESVWDKHFAVNVKSIFLTTKYAAPAMKKAGGGVIINMASIAGIRPRTGSAAYASSKAAAINLTKEIALELAPYKIRVNCLCPVVVADTRIAAQMIPKGVEVEKFKQAIIETIPLGRLNTVEDVAYAALYLASDESAMLTGTALNVDGGRGI